MPNRGLKPRSEFTLFKFVRLNRLKNSPRIWSLAPSFPTNHGMWKYLAVLKSTLAYPGPRNELRPAFPSQGPVPQRNKPGLEGVAWVTSQASVKEVATMQPVFLHAERPQVVSFIPDE